MQPQQQPQSGGGGGAGGFLGNIGRKLSTGADVAQRTVKAQALKAEILMKEGTVKGVKQEMGINIYAPLETGDQAEVARIFNEFKVKVDAINAEIAAKRMEIAELEKAGATPA